MDGGTLCGEIRPAQCLLADVALQQVSREKPSAAKGAALVFLLAAVAVAGRAGWVCGGSEPYACNMMHTQNSISLLLYSDSKSIMHTYDVFKYVLYFIIILY